MIANCYDKMASASQMRIKQKPTRTILFFNTTTKKRRIRKTEANSNNTTI